MAKRNYIIFINDILKSIDDIESFVSGLDFNSFKEDDKTASAVIRKLEILGEATRSIPATVKKKYQLIDWLGMSDMRNKLIHDYFGVDLEIVWKVARQELPPLRSQIFEILQKEKKGYDQPRRN